MLIIGENINATTKSVYKALENEDKKFIIDLAKKQIENGAMMLDLNVGPAFKEPKKKMQWLINLLKEEFGDIPLSIDSNQLDILQIGLETAKGSRELLINSTIVDRDKIKEVVNLAKIYNAKIVMLAMDKDNIPPDADSRIEKIIEGISYFQEFEFDLYNIYIDPIVLPIRFSQERVIETIKTLQQIQNIADPPLNTIMGLSNISQKAKNRKYINSAFLSMAIYSGLSAAILNPLDTELIKTLIASEMIIGKFLYCDNYYTAYKESYFYKM